MGTSFLLQGEVSPTDTTGNHQDRPRTCVLGVAPSRVSDTQLARVLRVVVCSLQTPLWAWLWPSPGGCLYPEAGVMKVKPKDCPVNQPGFTRVTAALSLKTQELSQHRLWPISPCRPPPYTSLSVPRPGGS